MISSLSLHGNSSAALSLFEEALASADLASASSRSLAAATSSSNTSSAASDNAAAASAGSDDVASVAGGGHGGEDGEGKDGREEGREGSGGKCLVLGSRVFTAALRACDTPAQMLDAYLKMMQRGLALDAESAALVAAARRCVREEERGGRFSFRTILRANVHVYMHKL